MSEINIILRLCLTLTVSRRSQEAFRGKTLTRGEKGTLEIHLITANVPDETVAATQGKLDRVQNDHRRKRNLLSRMGP